MYTVWEISDWFEKWAEHKGEKLRQLRMLKFLFYAQAQHIKETGTPLFEDADILAWQYGPVVQEVYNIYTKNNGEYVVQTNFDWNNYRFEDSRFLVKVWNTYHHLDDGELIEYSHNETVWKNNYSDDRNSENKISIEELVREYA